MNIVFFGSGEFGLPTLERLAREHRILAVVSQPDRPAGRGGVSMPTPIAAWAAAHLSNVPTIKPEKVGELEVVARIRELAGLDGSPGSPTLRLGSVVSSLSEGNVPADPSRTVFVVIAFGQKMPASLLDGVFAINLHASLLPRWRGAAPINAAILAGDTQTGNSVITLADRMDAGLVLGQSRRDIPNDMTAGELHDLLSADGPELVSKVLAEHLVGAIKPDKQDESLVTKAAKLSKKDGYIDFAMTAEAVRRRVHGLTPWPGVTVGFGSQGLKILRVREVAESSNLKFEISNFKSETGNVRSEISNFKSESTEREALPGQILDARLGHVACGGGTVLRLLEVQPAGKRPMSWDDFERGRKIEQGERLTAWTG